MYLLIVAGFLLILISLLKSKIFFAFNSNSLHLAILCLNNRFNLYASSLPPFLFGVISSRYFMIKSPKVNLALSLKSSYCSRSNWYSISFAQLLALDFLRKVFDMYLLWVRIWAVHLPLFLLLIVAISFSLSKRHCDHTVTTFFLFRKKRGNDY